MNKLSNEEIQIFINQLDFSKIGGELVPVITQDYHSNEVLMLAFANKVALEKTLETGFVHYYSRSRQTIWKKGETSGHVQEVQEIVTDCDNDSLLIKIHQTGAACHKGYYSCFHKQFKDKQFREFGNKVFDPKEVYEN